MTLDKIVFDIKEYLKQYNNDSDLDDRYIIHLFNIKRSKYLRQELNNFQRTTDITSTQTLCLKLEEIPVVQCNVGLDCETIVRTVRPIPKPLELHVRSALTQVRSTNRIDIPFNFLSKERAIYSEFGSFARGIYAFLDTDLHIYLISKMDTIKLLECITVTGVFEDPLELTNYTNCCSCEDNSSPCFNLYDFDYPIASHYIDLIKNEIIKELLLKFKIVEDTENNSEND